jgi:hypothetical protein
MAQTAIREVHIDLQEPHADQIKAYSLRSRFFAIRCGRRWGKTALDINMAVDEVLDGHYVGWFAPEYKFIAEAYRELASVLDPIKKTASRDGVFQAITGGRIDFWSLENEIAGRSRKYHLVIIDEGAFTKATMLDIWRKNIRPTLLDYKGSAIVSSNTNGIDADNFLWQICNQPEHGFTEYHAPTHNNPYLPADELEKLQAENHPLVYQQEYLAEFVDWSGVAFFALTSLTEDGKSVEAPPVIDAVFATIDSATKTGKDNDGTAVIYWATHKYGAKHVLTILDWDVQQIEGSLLEHWLPTVFQNLEALTKERKCRAGSLGAWIEDKASGMVLIQQAVRRGWPAQAIDSLLTSVGKSERAISVSGYVYRGMVKISPRAFDKVSNYKGTQRNHLLNQVLGFRIGEKEARDDDLLDCLTYGIAIALGDSAGF